MSSPVSIPRASAFNPSLNWTRHVSATPRQPTTTPNRAQSSTPTQQLARSAGTPSRIHRNSLPSAATFVSSSQLHRLSASISGTHISMREPSFGTQKEHNLTSFEWHVNEIGALKEEVDRPKEVWAVDGEESETHEIFKRGVVTNEGWYKFDISRSLPRPGTPSPPTSAGGTEASPAEVVDPHTVSLYIAALSLDTQSSEYSYTSSIFVGIKAVESAIGSRHGQTKWLWHTSIEWEFSRDAEYWECVLPELSSLLAMPEVLDSDAFSICIQIGSPDSNQLNFHRPGEQIVPRSILDGLSNLLDSATGDVKFVCLEHATLPLSPEREVSLMEEKTRHHTISRKRVVYAHSEVLKARCEYFKDLLTGGFSESELSKRSEGTTTVIVDDAGFETVYWMLRYVYTNELVFSTNDDVRMIVDQGSADKGEMMKMLSGAPGYTGALEWEYRRLPSEGEANYDMISNISEIGEYRDDFDTRTVRSVSSAGTSASRRPSAVSPVHRPSLPISGQAGRARSDSGSASTALSKESEISAPQGSARSISRVSGATSSGSRTRPPPSTNTLTPTKTRAGSAAPLMARGLSSRTPSTPSSSSGTIKANQPASSTSSKAVPKSSLSPKPANRGGSHHHPYPLPRMAHIEPDPHPHPSPLPPPAPALSVYILSHRYRLEGLVELAKDCLLEGLTAENCIPMLLATFRFEELHRDVLDYVVDNWLMVQSHPEFLRCIQEVSSGVWGETGGLVLHGLFKRL